jgi:glucose-1-phosphate thymidylyltransferase
MKGVILAGGSATRLSPVTKVLSKQLLPIYNKPLIYYPLSTLMLSGIKEILIICKSSQKNLFVDLLGDGSQFGINLQYDTQDEPRGIAEALKFANSHFPREKFVLILGDNLFHGPGLGQQLKTFWESDSSLIFGYKVKNPSEFGVVELDKEGSPLNIIEKPKIPKSDIAITGLYFFNHDYFEYYSDTEVGVRGELEITDVLSKINRTGKLSCKVLSRGTAWFDTGTFDGMHDASTYVRIIEERTGQYVGSPTEVSENQGWL